LPPSRKTAKADSDARECGATAIPLVPHFGCMIIVRLNDWFCYGYIVLLANGLL
jgi:hypothetical protein